MVLLGSVSTTIHENDDDGNRSGHKPTEQKWTNRGYMHKGFTIYRDMFTFLHGIGKHRVQNIKAHFSENGLIPRTQGNSIRQSHNALSFGTILNVLNFLQNYAEQRGIYYLIVFLGLSEMMRKYYHHRIARRYMVISYFTICHLCAYQLHAPLSPQGQRMGKGETVLNEIHAHKVTQIQG